MGLPVRGQRTRTQVSLIFWRSAVGCVVLLDCLLTWITTDYDGEEVQPHGQDEIGSPGLLFLFFNLSRLACCQAELARRTECITVKIPMYKRTL